MYAKEDWIEQEFFISELVQKIDDKNKIGPRISIETPRNND